MVPTIRRATGADRLAIHRLVWQAGLYPLRLAWPHFTVVEEDRRIVGVAQVRPHRDGARELASVVVSADRRGCGLSRVLVTRLLSEEDGPVFLVCRSDLIPYYARFGFKGVSAAAAPRSIARLRTIEDLATRLLTVFGGTPRRLVIMKRP